MSDPKKMRLHDQTYSNFHQKFLVSRIGKDLAINHDREIRQIEFMKSKREIINKKYKSKLTFTIFISFINYLLKIMVTNDAYQIISD